MNHAVLFLPTPLLGIQILPDIGIAETVKGILGRVVSILGQTLHHYHINA